MIWPGLRLFPHVDPGEPIFGLTMQQPFGSAIIEGPKRIENRPWEPPRRLRGRAFWLAMHAGATFYPGVTVDDFRIDFKVAFGNVGRRCGRRAPTSPPCRSARSSAPCA